jgi:hypothetical protein
MTRHSYLVRRTRRSTGVTIQFIVRSKLALRTQSAGAPRFCPGGRDARRWTNAWQTQHREIAMNRTGVSGVLLAAAMAGAAMAGAQPARRVGAEASTTRFAVRVENVSTRTTLKLAKGGALDMPLSAGVWAVHTGGNPMLTPGKMDAGLGLKGLAEAGMAQEFDANLARVPGVRSHGVLDKPMTAAMVPVDGPMLISGAQVDFIIEARPGDQLSLAFMLGQSNDGIIGTGATGIALFDAKGRPVAGDVTSAIGLWDAGTEVNEEPGVGRNQGMRQGAPTAGDPERRPVRPMSEAEFGRNWPAANRMLRVTITPVKR